MSVWGLGCAKTLAVAPHVEISPGNCIPESQIILHTRGSMPCWRIVFSTFCGCMSFYTGSVIHVALVASVNRPHVRFGSESDRIAAQQPNDAQCQQQTHAMQRNQPEHAAP